MPVFKRKRTYSQTRIVKRRKTQGSFKSKYRPPRPRMGLSSNVHIFKRYATPYTVTLAGTTEQQWNEIFKLSNVQNSSELTNLYDQYKIMAVVCKLQLINNPDVQTPPGANPATSTSNPMFYPKLWVLRDYDSSTGSSLSALRETGKAKMYVLQPNRILSFKVKPACARQVYDTAVTTGYEPTWPKKLDCNNASIPHYGLHFNIDTLGITPWNAGQFQVRVEYLYYLKMMNTR